MKVTSASRHNCSRFSSTVSRGRLRRAQEEAEKPSPVHSDPPVSRKYQAPTNPSGIPLSKLLTPHFPLSYRESYTDWKARDQLQEAQNGVLSFLPFFPTMDSDGRLGKSIKVPVGDNGVYMNEFEISRPEESDPRHLVLLHGYGAGLGFFYRNFESISQPHGWTIHALDLLGYGLSSRPKFKIEAKDDVDGVLKAEDWFITALERWRQERGIEKFTLIAHSLGAYIGTQYAIRFRERVNKIMLVSPAGVDRNPHSIPKENLRHTLLPGETVNALHVPSREVKPAPVWFKFLWERHVSPFSLVRYSGPLGPKFTSGWTARRFANLPEDQANALHKYAYAIFNARGSGEYALNYLLAPGGYGRWPLSERAYRLPCPSLWVYGDRDWMDPQGGVTACANIAANNGPAAKCITIPDAGHHLYLDNSSTFNSLATEFMEQTYEHQAVSPPITMHVGTV